VDVADPRGCQGDVGRPQDIDVPDDDTVVDVTGQAADELDGADGDESRRADRAPSVEAGSLGASAAIGSGTGDPASPIGDRLRLLPSGPDLVHEPTSSGTRPSTHHAAR
jgi:hypothetical protein